MPTIAKVGRENAPYHCRQPRTHAAAIVIQTRSATSHPLSKHSATAGIANISARAITALGASRHFIIPKLRPARLNIAALKLLKNTLPRTGSQHHTGMAVPGDVALRMTRRDWPKGHLGTNRVVAQHAAQCPSFSRVASPNHRGELPYKLASLRKWIRFPRTCQRRHSECQCFGFLLSWCTWTRTPFGVGRRSTRLILPSFIRRGNASSKLPSPSGRFC